MTTPTTPRKEVITADPACLGTCPALCRYSKGIHGTSDNQASFYNPALNCIALYICDSPKAKVIWGILAYQSGWHTEKMKASRRKSGLCYLVPLNVAKPVPGLSVW